MQYASAKDIADTMSKEKIKQKLKELGIPFHPANGEEKLSTLLFEAYGNIKPKGEAIELEDLTVEQSPVQEEILPVDANRLNSAAEAIRKEALKTKGAKKTEKKTYISKKFNHWVSTRGKDATGRVIRYIVGQESLYPEKQKGVAFKVENLRFRGVEGTTFDFKGFQGRSILNVTDPKLMEYIESLKGFGKTIIHYDKNELAREAIIQDKMVTRLKYWAYEAEKDDLVSVLAYIEGRAGKRTFKKLMDTIDENTLITRAIGYINKDAEAFLDVMEETTPKLYHLVHKAELYKIIKVSRDGRDIKMGENGVLICHSSLAGDWEHDLIAHLTSPKGGELLSRLQRDLDYYVV